MANTETENKEQVAVSCMSVLADVLRYRRGLGRYNMSKFPYKERGVRTIEAWEELETRIERTLSEAGVKVS